MNRKTYHPPSGSRLPRSSSLSRNSDARPSLAGSAARRPSLSGARPSIAGSAARSSNAARLSRSASKQAFIPQASGQAQQGAVGERNPKQDARLQTDGFSARCRFEIHMFCQSHEIAVDEAKLFKSKATTAEFRRLFEALAASIIEQYSMGQIDMKIEFPNIMKSLGYPFKFSKSMMSTISNNWDMFMGSLLWLKQLAVYAEVFRMEDQVKDRNHMILFFNIESKMALDEAKIQLDSPDAKRVIAPHLQRLRQQVLSSGDIVNLEAEREDINQKVDEQRQKEKADVKKQDIVNSLRTDRDNLMKFLNDCEKYIMQCDDKVGGFESELRQQEDTKKGLQATLDGKKATVEAQPFSKVDVERMVFEEQQISTDISVLDARTKELTEECAGREMKYNQTLSKVKAQREQSHRDLRPIVSALPRNSSLIPTIQELLSTPLAPSIPQALQDGQKLNQALVEQTEQTRDDEYKTREELMRAKYNVDEARSTNADMQTENKQIALSTEDMEQKWEELRRSSEAESLSLDTEKKQLSDDISKLKTMESMSCDEKQKELERLRLETHETEKEHEKEREKLWEKVESLTERVLAGIAARDKHLQDTLKEQKRTSARVKALKEVVLGTSYQ